MLSGTCDLPAKAVCLNMIGHNGFYGCPYCLQPGETYFTNTDGRGHVHVYPYEHQHTIYRDKTSVRRYAKEALENNTVTKGIHPPGSCLMFFPVYDIVKGTGIDYMHCILLNVVRRLVHLWFDSTHHAEQWSCSRKLHLADTRLKSIKPPTTISRCPRSLSERKLWKASEFRAWFFFYSLPVMLSILPSEYYHHYGLLCEAIFLLNSSCISEASLKKAKKLLKHFYFKFSALYSERYLSCNLHQLLHLSDTVKDLGPLYTFSCFDHENCNGIISRMVHSNCSVDSQIVSAFSNLQCLSSLSRVLSFTDEQSFLLQDLIPHSGVYTTLAKDTQLVGACQVRTVDAGVKHLLQPVVQTVPSTFFQYSRLKMGNAIYHSQLYERPTKINNTAICFRSCNNTESFGVISFFCKIPGVTLAVVKPLITTCNSLIDDPITHAESTNIIQCYPPVLGNSVAIPIDRILCKVVYMHFDDVSDTVYIAKFPNLMESD